MSNKVKVIESVMKILREKNSEKDDGYFENIFDRLSDMGQARLENYEKIIKKL